MTRVGLLLLPEFPLIPFACIVEALRLTNRHMGSELYGWTLVSGDGRPVRSSSGLETYPDHSLADIPRLDLLLVVAGAGAEARGHKSIAKQLAQVANSGVMLGAVTLGAFVLAEAGLLAGYRCTVHWEFLDAFRERYPRLEVCRAVFEIDRDRLTCSGGTAALDMMLSFIGRQHGAALARDVAELVIHDRVREASEPQRMPANLRLGVSHPKLTKVIEIMEQSSDETFSTDELGSRVGLSGRQLERLFRKYLDTTPKRYHLTVRLGRARHLLQQTTMSVLDVALASGFSTASHFTRTYREHFGITPREDRPAHQIRQ